MTKIRENIKTHASHYRKDLSLFFDALDTNSFTEYKQILKGVNQSNILKVFPIWLANLTELNSVLPLEKDLFDLVGFNNPKEKIEELFPRSETTIQLSENQELIYKNIAENPHVTLDDLAEKISVASHKILPVILELELLGKVKSYSGRQFLAI